MSFATNIKRQVAAIFAIAGFVLVPVADLAAAPVMPTAQSPNNLGVITGYVRDQVGNPIADATIAIFRSGTSKLLKQVESTANGKFLAKIIPGKYSVMAVAQGFNPVTIDNVEIGQAAHLEYGFKLERAGSGNTLPEKRLDRNNPKWNVRAAALGRSIYQNNDGSNVEVSETASVSEEKESAPSRKIHAVAATYYSASDYGNFTGFNVAALIPLKDGADLTIAGQAGIGKEAPERVDTELRFKPVEDHYVRVRSSYGKLGELVQEDTERSLGQFTLQATDEWTIRDGVILVYGFDYSKFTGAGNDFSISPRLGFQFDLDPKTRVRTAYTTQTEETSWSRALELEGTSVAFREPIAIEDLTIENGKPLMNKSSRIEIGIERVLDNKSTIEANAFVDTIFGKGVGFTFTPFDSADGAFTNLAGNQQGSAKGVRFVYARRISGHLSASAGYSFGQGQKISHRAITTPGELFETGTFRSLFGQLEADLSTGTNVRTVFRLSPNATVFAIDPFQGRLAIYDPGLSILITQNLPTMGLPIQAEAVIDARNVFDFKNGVFNEEGALRMNSPGATLRGGILVRF